MAEPLGLPSPVFYMIQLIPDIRPLRIKFGIANDLSQRLRTHRCTCPQARVYASWPIAAAQHEKLLIAYIMERRPRCTRIGVEVLDVDDLEGVRDCIDEWREVNLDLRRGHDIDPTAWETIHNLEPSIFKKPASRHGIGLAKLEDVENGRQLPADLTVL